MGSIQLDTASGRDRSRAFVKIIASAAVATGFCVFCLSNASAADEKERSADPLGDIAQDMKAASAGWANCRPMCLRRKRKRTLSTNSMC